MSIFCLQKWVSFNFFIPIRQQVFWYRPNATHTHTHYNSGFLHQSNSSESKKYFAFNVLSFCLSPWYTSICAQLDKMSTPYMFANVLYDRQLLWQESMTDYRQQLLCVLVVVIIHRFFVRFSLVVGIFPRRCHHIILMDSNLLLILLFHVSTMETMNELKEKLLTFFRLSKMHDLKKTMN